jgi:hypothetical protein
VKHPLPSFIDFEASSLASRSFPIEVAWNLEDGYMHSYLISPATIPRWKDWNPASAKIHGISMEELLANGRAPAEVCGLMIETLSGKTVYCDAPSFDGMWLGKLFVKGIAAHAPFQLKHVDELLAVMIGPTAPDATTALETIAALKIEARKLKPRRHRAAWDVEYLIQLWELARLRPTLPVG